jgi:hypothetical protein
LVLLFDLTQQDATAAMAWMLGHCSCWNPKPLNLAGSEDLKREGASALQPDKDGRSCTGWFDAAFGNRDTVPWDEFWDKLDKLAQ